MRAFLLSFVLLVLLGVIYAQRARYERYDEEVLVHVGTHSVTTHFQFTIDVNISSLDRETACTL